MGPPQTSTTPRMSSSRTMRCSSPSSSTSEPEYLPNRMVSPTFTPTGISLPSSFTLPLPTATILPCSGFCFAVSGMMIPPFVFSNRDSARRPDRCALGPCGKRARGGRRKTGSGGLPGLVQSGGGSTIRARRRAAALVLVRGGRQGLHGSDRDRSVVRDGLLGCRHEHVLPALVSAQRGHPEGRVGRPRPREGRRREDAARARLPRRDRDVLSRLGQE